MGHEITHPPRFVREKIEGCPTKRNYQSGLVEDLLRTDKVKSQSDMAQIYTCTTDFGKNVHVTRKRNQSLISFDMVYIVIPRRIALHVTTVHVVTSLRFEPCVALLGILHPQ